LIGGSGLFAGGAAASTAPSITTVAGTGIRGFSGDGGPAVNANLNTPTGVAEDLVGTLYVADTANNRVRKIVMPTAIHSDVITTIAGTGTKGFRGDESLATSAELNNPSGLAVDSHGNVFIADTGNNRIRKMNAEGIISTFAGTGACRKHGEHERLGNGGPATSASLCGPTGIALDRFGDLFIADTGHDVVREVQPNGTIVGFAGTGNRGPEVDVRRAADATLDSPTGLAIDNTLGNVYIADTGHNQVRVVDPHGNMSTLAGTGRGGFSGDGGPATRARLDFPTGLGVDPSGDVFISDTGNARIREVDTDTAKTISTFAGTGKRGFSGDGGPATAANVNTPTGEVAADGSAVYFSDTANQRVRGIFTGPPPVLPQSDLAILLPLTGAVVIVGILGGGAVLRRIRQRRKLVA
jgi:sugar lactone lactonase YvrE